MTVGVLYFYLPNPTTLPPHPPWPSSGTPVSPSGLEEGKAPVPVVALLPAGLGRPWDMLAPWLLLQVQTVAVVRSKAGCVCGKGEENWAVAEPERQGKYFCRFLSRPLPRLTATRGLSHWGQGMGQTKFFHSAPSPVTRLT